MNTILIVDDSRLARLFVSSALMSIGFEVEVAHSATDAHHGRELSSLELLRRVPPEIPSLVFSAESSPALIERARESGARGWIVKPANAQTLCAVVLSVIGPPTIAAPPRRRATRPRRAARPN